MYAHDEQYDSRLTGIKWCMHDITFMWSHNNCSKEGPPAMMQASHHWQRKLQILANTLGIFQISPALTAILVTRSLSVLIGFHKLDSSYGPRERSLGRKGQVSVSMEIAPNTIIGPPRHSHPQRHKLNEYQSFPD